MSQLTIDHINAAYDSMPNWDDIAIYEDELEQALCAPRGLTPAERRGRVRDIRRAASRLADAYHEGLRGLPGAEEAFGPASQYILFRASEGIARAS